MFDLTTRDIKFISGVGPQKAAVLNKELEIYSLYDLIYYFPYKYVDRSRIYYIHEIDGNMPYIQLKGEILGFETIGEGRQRRLTAHFSDGTGIVDLVWFQGIKYILGKYKLHEEYIIFGKPTVFNGRINVAHPDIDKPDDLKLSSVGLQPYYNTTEKMKRSFLNSHAIEKMMATVIQQIQEPLPETLSQDFVGPSSDASDRSTTEYSFPYQSRFAAQSSVSSEIRRTVLCAVEYSPLCERPAKKISRIHL